MKIPFSDWSRSGMEVPIPFDVLDSASYTLVCAHTSKMRRRLVMAGLAEYDIGDDGHSPVGMIRLRKTSDATTLIETNVYRLSRDEWSRELEDRRRRLLHCYVSERYLPRLYNEPTLARYWAESASTEPEPSAQDGLSKINGQILELWIARYTASEIGDIVKMSPGRVGNIITDLRKRLGKEAVPLHRKS